MLIFHEKWSVCYKILECPMRFRITDGFGLAFLTNCLAHNPFSILWIYIRIMAQALPASLLTSNKLWYQQLIHPRTSEEVHARTFGVDTPASSSQLFSRSGLVLGRRPGFSSLLWSCSRKAWPCLFQWLSRILRLRLRLCWFSFWSCIPYHCGWRSTSCLAPWWPGLRLISAIYHSEIS